MRDLHFPPTSPLGTNPMSRNQSSSKWETIKYENLYEFKWTCCECLLHGGMDVTVTLACPNIHCDHRRCERCSIDSVKRGRSEIVTVAQQQSYKSQSSLFEEPKPSRPRHKALIGRASQRQSSATKVAAKDSVGRLSATEASSTKSSITEPPSNSSGLQLPMVSPRNQPNTPTSSPASTVDSKPSEIFTPQQSSPESQSDSISSDISSEDENIDHGAQNYEDHALNTLESRLLIVLDNDLDLAARLLPRVFAQTRTALRQSNVESARTVPTSHDTKEQAKTLGEANVTSSTLATSNGSNFSSSHPRKRSRDPEDPEEQQNHPFKKPKPASGGVQRKFACHFNKRDPTKYNPQIRKYRSCAAPSVPELRRIKEHFEGSHGPFHCGRCWETFRKPKLLMEHCASRELCIEKPSLEKCGFNDRLWREIVSLVKAKRGLIAGERERHEIERWYDIWRVIFPGVPEPSNPWNELPCESSGRAYSMESILEALQQFVDFDIEQGTLRRDDQVHRYYMSRFRLCFQAEMAASVETFNNVNIPTAEQNSSEPRLQDRLRDSTELEVIDGILADEYPEPRNAEQTREGSHFVDSDPFESLVHFQPPVSLTTNMEFADAGSAWAPEFDTLNEVPNNMIHAPSLVSEDETNRSNESHLVNAQLQGASFDLAYTPSQNLDDDLWGFDFDLDMEAPDVTGSESLWDGEAPSNTQDPSNDQSDIDLISLSDPRRVA